MKLSREIVEDFATRCYGSQAAVGRALRFAGYRFANKQFRIWWNDIHGMTNIVNPFSVPANEGTGI